MRAAPHRGHERRLKSGAWEVQVSLAGQRRTVKGDTLTEARARLAELVADHQRGLTGRDARRERTPLAQWLRAWLEGRRGTVVPSTWAMHRVCVERRLVPLLGRVALRDLEAADVRRAYARLQRPPYGHAPGTVRRTHATLSLALQQAVSDGVLARNVARGIALPRRPRSEARALTPDEVRRLLRAAPAERRPLWAVAVYTGLRTGELLGLCWGDVALDAPRPSLTVQRVAVDADAEGESGRTALRDEPKNASSVRTLTLPREAVDALREQRRLQVEARLRAPRWAGTGRRHGGLVFASQRGTPRLRTNVRREFVADARAAGVVLPPGMALHALRHSYVSALLAAGRPITEVAYLLGHSSPSTTLRTYAHWVRGDLSAAADALSQHYAGG
jgi:integrase